MILNAVSFFKFYAIYNVNVVTAFVLRNVGRFFPYTLFVYIDACARKSKSQ